jgi:hypothetical protein
MSDLSKNVRGALHLIASDFFVVTGKEINSGMSLSVLWSGPDAHLAYFQKRIFGSHPVSLRRVGRRPVLMLDRLMNVFNCSAAIIIQINRITQFIWRDDDVRAPLWVGCDVELSADRLYAKSESMRGDLRNIRRNELDWTISRAPDDLRSFFENIYLPTVTSSHGGSALPSSLVDRLHQFQSGSMELLQVLRKDEVIAGVTIDYQFGVPALRDSGVLSGADEIKKTGAISAAYLFAMDYLSSKGYSSVWFGLSRSFLHDGVLNYKRKFRPIVTSGSDDYILMRVRQLDEPTRSMLKSSACISMRDGILRRTYFCDAASCTPASDPKKRGKIWNFGLDKELIYDISGDSLQLSALA